MNTQWLRFGFIPMIVTLMGCDSSSSTGPAQQVFSYYAENISRDEMGEPHVGNSTEGLELIGFWAGCGVGDEAVDPRLTRFAEGEIEIDLYITQPQILCLLAVHQRYSLFLFPLSAGEYHIQFRYHFVDLANPPNETEWEVINEVVTIKRRENSWPHGAFSPMVTTSIQGWKGVPQCDSK